MSLLDFLGFGKRKKMIEDFLSRGAIVIDVRSQSEFVNAHANGSINIPLESVKHKITRIKKYKKPVILICATGNRSGTASYLLRDEGIESMNGGGWRRFA